MAPEKASRLPNNPPPPPPPESEEEDPLEEIEEVEEESEEEEEVEEFEEESEVEEKESDKAMTPLVQPSEVSKKPSLQKRTTPLPSAPETDEERSKSGEGEREEWEESDYPESPIVSDFAVKPIAHKKPAGKDSKPTMKRPSKTQKDDERDLRSRKKAKTNEEQEKKGKSSPAVSAPGDVGKVWSEEDEIALLQGMIDYQKKKGAEPSNNMVAFHEFVKGRLFADVSKTQLYDKVRRLKKKLLANVEKAENGEDPVFSGPHEFKAFNLSKKIWGSEAIGSDDNDNANGKGNNTKVKRGGKIGSLVKEVEKKDAAMDDLEADKDDFLSKYPNLIESFDPKSSTFLLADGAKRSLKDKLSLIGSAKAGELEKKWKKIREEETEIFFKKMNLIAEQTKLLLDATKKR